MIFDRQSLMFRDLQARGAIKLSDVLRLRRDYFPNGVETEAQAQALLAINAACPVQDTAWSAFLVELVSDYIVHTAKPEGYMTAGNARWLIGHAASSGRIERLTCLELVITVLEIARWCPPSLPAFALRQIEMAIMTGTGPLRTAATSGKGRVGKTEVALIRRILAAGGRAGSDAITQAEGEVLLDIHDATLLADNCLEWTELVTKALANLVMTASGYAPPPRAEALEPETWLDPSTPTADFLQRMTLRGFKSVLGAYGQRSAEQTALASLDHEKIEIITAESIVRLEPSWLAMRIGQTVDLAPPAHALLAYLRTESRALHPALQPLVERAA